jgi:hypothetical protein
MALSDTQLVVLTAACRRPDRAVYPLTAKLPGGAAAKVLGALLRQELIKEVQAKREDTVWREDKKRGRLTLRATPAAFKALGIDPAETPPGVDADAGEAATEANTSARSSQEGQGRQGEDAPHARRQQAGQADRDAQAP